MKEQRILTLTPDEVKALVLDGMRYRGERPAGSVEFITTVTSGGSWPHDGPDVARFDGVRIIMEQNS